MITNAHNVLSCVHDLNCLIIIIIIMLVAVAMHVIVPGVYRQ